MLRKKYCISSSVESVVYSRKPARKMITTLILSWGLAWAVVLLKPVLAHYTEPTHIVFIMVDDMGWNDVSFHGSDQIQTPNIDALAYQGVILQQYYSEAICTPARAALLTGKYPMRTGMHGFPLMNSEDRGIPLTERLLPSYLKELGYATHLVGKWHVGMSREEFLPTSRGYDSHYGMRGGYIDYYTYDKIEQWPNSGPLFYGLDLFDNDVPQEREERYIVDALTERAINIIGSHNASRPLFLHVTHNAPHAGNEGAGLQPPLYSSVGNKHIANSDRRLYANIVNHIDRSVGGIVKALAEKDILDNTIIVFVSDNGSPTVGELSNWGVNLPFRGRKSTPWEGGVRVPAFIWHADFTPYVWNGLMHITDWLPTLIAAAGGELRGNIDGVNQWQSITQGGFSKRKEVLISVEDSARNVYAAYRAGNYKVVLGNVSGLFNDYYGEEFMMNKYPPPDYLSALQACEVTEALTYLGKFLDFEEVEAMRNATIVTQLDAKQDTTPCLPSPSKGCLYNVHRDPAERHDIWDRAPKIANILVSRLRGLWAQQQRRGPLALNQEANPANYGYVWSPWIYETKENDTIVLEKTSNSEKIGSERSFYSFNDKSKNTVANAIDCDNLAYFSNFLCILRSAF